MENREEQQDLDLDATASEPPKPASEPQKSPESRGIEADADQVLTTEEREGDTLRPREKETSEASTEKLPDSADEQLGQSVHSQSDLPPGFGDEETQKQAVGVKTGDIAGEAVTIIGQLIGDGPEIPNLIAFPPESVDRLQSLFVAPSSFDKMVALATIEKNPKRIWIIHGPENSGKWTCAVNFASRVKGISRASILEYDRRPDSMLSLPEVIRSKEVPRGAVVILRDAFEKSISTADLEGSRLEELIAILGGSDTILLLTTERNAEEVDSFSTGKLEIAGIALKKVLERHLELVAKNGRARGEDVTLDRSSIMKSWAELKKHLLNPLQIRRFCEKLEDTVTDMGGEISPDDLLRMARSAARIGRKNLGEWFSALSPDDQLLAILTYLFEGVERVWIESLHQRLVHRMRAKGHEWFCDPLAYGLDDSLESIQAYEFGGRVEFRERCFEEEVQRQVGNWRHLVWYLLSYLVNDSENGEYWKNRQRRRGLGLALGRAGTFDSDALAASLDQLAERESRQLSVVAGYALQETLRLDFVIHYEFVVRTLKRWIDPPQSEEVRPERMWVAGAAIWKVYLNSVREIDSKRGVDSQPVGGVIFDLLELFCANIERVQVPKEEAGADARWREWTGRRRHLGKGELRYKIIEALKWCASEAMKRICLADPLVASKRLESWLCSGKDRVQQEVARRTIRMIFEVFARANGEPSRLQVEAFLVVVGPLLEVAGYGSKDVEIIFLTLRGWLRWSDTADVVVETLMEVANHGSVRARELMRSAVSEIWLQRIPTAAQRWLKEDHPNEAGRWEGGASVPWVAATHGEAHRVAQALIARSLAMDGSVSDLPSMGRGVVVVDPSFLHAFASKSEELERVKSFCWNVLGMLESRMEVCLVRMGELQTIESVEDHLGKVELAGEYATHPLIMPGLGGVEGENLEVGVVIATRRPHDFEDLLAVPWAQNLDVILAGDVPWGPNEIEPLKIKEAPTDRDLRLVEDALNDRWARRLAFTGPASWLGILHGFGLDIRRVEEIPVVLSSMVSSLGDIEQACGHEDVARIMLCLFLTYASWELDDCLDLLVDWLRSAEEEGGEWRLRRSMAVASSRALLAIHTSYSEDGEEHAPLSLFEKLAYPLAAQSRDGIETVLGLVEHWAGHPTWAGYLAGGIQEGQGRLVRWAETFLPDQRELLESSFTKLASLAAPDQPEISWDALMSTLNQVRIRFSLERPASLPRLEEGRLYGVIVVDTAIKDQEVRRHLGDLGRSLYRGFKKGDGAWPVEPVVYRLGERRPFWAGYPDSPPTSRLIPSEVKLPRLVCPILESGNLAVEKVAFVLILTNQPIVDLDDWMGSVWWKRIHRYPHDRSKTVKPDFATFPRPRASEWASKESKGPQNVENDVTGEEVRALMRSLLEGFAKSEWEFAGAESEPLEGTTGGVEG